MSGLSPKARKRLLLALLLVVGIAVGLVSTHRKEISELVVYVLGAERMAAGEEIYRPDDAKPFTYPPAFAMPFMVFQWVPEGAHRTVWFFVNLATFVGIVLMLRRLLLEFLSERGEGPPGTLWIWVVTFLLAGRHVSAVFENQSHDMMVFFLVALATFLATREREGLCGVAIGVAASFKATPLLFVPVFAWQRRFAAAALTALATGIMLWLPDLFFSRLDGEYWVMAWYHTFIAGIGVGETATDEGAWRAWNMLNQNLAGTLYRLATPVKPIGRFVWDVSLVDLGSTALKATTLALQASILAFLCWCTRPKLGVDDSQLEGGFRRLGEAGIVACGMVLLSPMSSKAHFCVLLMALMFTVTHYLAVRRDRIQLLLLIGVFVTGTLTVKGLVGTAIGNQFLAYGFVCWSTVLVLIATGRALRIGFRAES
ncbi:glycosyltransferase family 87 protein [Thermodesulfobacteriota bacterium]